MPTTCSSNGFFLSFACTPPSKLPDFTLQGPLPTLPELSPCPVLSVEGNLPCQKGKYAQLQLSAGRRWWGRRWSHVRAPHGLTCSTALQVTACDFPGKKRRIFNILHALSSKSLMLGCYRRSRSSKKQAPGDGESQRGIAAQHPSEGRGGSPHATARQSQNVSPAAAKVCSHIFSFLRLLSPALSS